MYRYCQINEGIPSTLGHVVSGHEASCKKRAGLFPTLMMNNQTCSIKLFCWILDVSDQSFSISIDDSQTVDDLKEAIIKTKSTTFANIEADPLELRKVSSIFNFRCTTC
jgi:hypothetical protein